MVGPAVGISPSNPLKLCSVLKVCPSASCEPVTIRRIATAMDATAMDATAILKSTPLFHLRCCIGCAIVNLLSDQFRVLIKLLVPHYGIELMTNHYSLTARSCVWRLP